MPYAPLSDGKLWYDRAGDEGSPVLLVMGLGMRGRAWRFQIEALAQDHRCVWFDGRGVGETRAPTRNLSMRRMADDAIALMDHLGWEDAHVAGISMGGMIAQEIALRHRDRVRSLSLVATHPGGWRWRVPPLSGLATFVVAQVAPGSGRLAAVQRLLYTEEYLDEVDREALDRELVEGLGIRRSGRDLIAQVGAVVRHDTRRRLRRLEGLPTLIIKPLEDRLIRPSASDSLHRRIPGSTLVAIPRGGHGVMRERSAQVNQALVGHLRTVDAVT